MISNDNSLQRFMLEHTRVRGQFVHLSTAWQAVIAKRDYPRPVQTLLGEAITATVLMGAILKFKGSISLQVQSKGPVSLLVAQVSSERTLRGLAMWKDSITDERPSAMLQMPSPMIRMRSCRLRARNSWRPTRAGMT